MVSSEKGDSIRVFDFKAEQVLKGFNWMVSSINEITDEDVATVFDISSWVDVFVPVLKSSRTS